MLTIRAVTLVCAGLLWCRLGAAQPKSAEASLFKQLMASTEYDSRIKPTVNANGQITATISFSLGRIESLDEKSQILTTFGVMSVAWTDELLQWNPLSYGEIYRIVVPAKNIWLPEIAMFNSVSDDAKDLSLDTDFRAQIFYDGTVAWSPSFLWKTSCAIDLRYFPFDEQICYVQFVNWMHTAASLNFTVEDPIVDTETYDPNGEWDLKSAEQLARTFELEGGQTSLPMFQMTLKLQRVPTFFLLNVVMPSIMLTALSLLVYWLPYESGEKISMSITVLLSFSIVLLMISDVTPRNGNKMPILTWYIASAMAVSGLSLVITVGILNIYHHSPTRPVPGWVRTVVLNGLARLFCMHTNDVAPKRNAVQPIDNAHVEDLPGEKKPHVPENPLIPPEIINYVRGLIEKGKEADRQDQNREEWILVGKVLDKTCLVCFMLVITIASGILFPIMEVNGND